MPSSTFPKGVQYLAPAAASAAAPAVLPSQSFCSRGSGSASYGSGGAQSVRLPASAPDPASGPTSAAGIRSALHFLTALANDVPHLQADHQRPS